MKRYRVVLRGRAATSAIGDWNTRAITVQAWDRGEVKTLVGRRIRNGYRINEQWCDQVVVSSIKSAN